MREVTPEECKKLQLNILINVAAFCDEHNIKYSLAYGTLIGAIRHKGFIPWDDDIDIIMMRDEYVKFVSSYNDDYFELVKGKDLSNHLHVRVADPNTRLEFRNSQRSNKFYKSGLWVDVFPIDNIPDDEAKYQKLKKSIRYLYLLQCVGEVKGYNIFHYIAHFFLMPFTKVFGYMADKKVVSFNGVKTEKVAALSLWHNNFPPFSRAYLKEFVDVTFEGHQFKAISRYDEFLRAIYGDYMQLPPEDQRKPKHEYVVYWRE